MKLKILFVSFFAAVLSACSTTSQVDFKKTEKTYASYVVRDASEENIPEDKRKLLLDYLNQELSQMGYKTGEDLEIVISVKKFNEGNRALRYWVGFGAGKASSEIATTLVDKESGNVVANIKTDGSLSMGFFGGNADSILKRAAKDIASKIAATGVLEK